MRIDPKAPVLIGTAQQVWREPDATRRPIDGLISITQQAVADTQCPGLLEQIDTIAAVRFIMETDPNLAPMLPHNPGHLLAQELGILAPTCLQTDVGGNTPQYLVNRCAERLASGESDVALICGAEMLNSFFDALRNGGDLSAWQGQDSDTPKAEFLGEAKDGANALEKAHGLYEPINTYPLFENALQHQLGVTRDAHMSQVAEFSSRMTEVAANNPIAWKRTPLSATEIGEVTPANRYIGFPYTKAMNAILAVDMAAAVIMTTAERALALGIPAEQLVYFRAGADVNDSWYVSQREDLHRAPAIGLAAKAVQAHANIELEDIEYFDVYSCFPSAMQIACREIGLSPLDARGVTVTGGLPYFGGPGNNYSLHAIAEMVARLRGKADTSALVTANGLYLTKHSLGLYSTIAPTGEWQALDSNPLQAQIDAMPTRELAADPTGEAQIDSYTIAYGRSGPKRAIVIATNKRGERVLACSENSDTITSLLEDDPIGLTCHITVSDELNQFEME
jgi:acetyl-CoA C-acetyltransferase